MLNGRVEFAEIRFFFLTKIGDKHRPLALVQLYSGPDPDLFERSSWMVYSITQLSQEDGYRLVHVKSIMSVVAVIPHDHHVVPGDQRFFVWEQMGLDMSTLGVPEPDLES